MKSQFNLSHRVLATFLAMMAAFGASAFPPAPHHSVFGMVRDERGNPLVAVKATVYLEMDGRIVTKAPVSSSLELGVNYRLTIPLDAGATADRYKPTALLPSIPFRLRVQIGNKNYLPIEMSNASSLMTKAAGVSRIDLTLGEDSDGDGLPDAWERALLAATKGKKNISEIRPDDDEDGDGLSNLKEYLAGTYAFDPKDGFGLSIESATGGRAQLAFTVIRGRSYTIEASSDMKSWSRVSFSLATESSNVPFRDVYVSTDVRPLRVVAAPSSDESAIPKFFRLMVN